MLKRFLKTLLYAIGVLGVLYAAMAGWMWWQIQPVDRPSAYERVLTKRWHDPTLVAHFPPQIPAQARAVKFHYQQGFLQGGSSIELRYQAPPDHVKQVIEKYKPVARLVVRNDDMHNQNIDMLHKRYFRTVDKSEITATPLIVWLPAGFEIIALISRPYVTDPISWNHGQSAGISVSVARNELIFWAEDW